MTEPVYLDYAATTPVDPRVRQVMLGLLDAETGYANPSSATHAAGQAAQAVVDMAAAQVAELIHASAEELIWTSGATESNSLAIIGAARFRAIKGRHIVTVATEHKSVLESCAALEQEGFSVTYLQPDRQGLLAPERVAAALQPDTTLVSVMHANNEIGVIQDIAAIGKLCREQGVLFHVDAAQSAGKLPVDVQAQSIDLLSLNAHKACGPKGVGALYLNKATIPRIEPLFHGGGQQRGLRPGTLPVHQIAGMGEAFRILVENAAVEVTRIAGLRDDLWSELSQIPGVELNGHPENRLCSILNVRVSGVEGESLQFALQRLAVASGSACNSASGEPSYVLRSLGLEDYEAEASIRFSLGRFSTAGQIKAAATTFADAVAHLRALSPVEVSA